ncbi:hypothetical protein D3C87_1991720 [compost metagenome]
MVAAVASEEPQMAPKPAQAPIADMPMPPFQWPMKAEAQRKIERDRPPWVANWPISTNSGITARS